MSRMQAAICRAAAIAYDWAKGRIPMASTKLIRTSLYASGASPVNTIQAVFYNQDCMVYDLEDSVPLTEKDTARVSSSATWSA